MSDSLQDLIRERDRWKKRYERERSAREQAEAIGEVAVRDLARFSREHEALFSLSLDLLCTIDQDLRFQELNPAWEDTLGFRPEELRGTTLLALVHPQDAEKTASEAERLASGTTRTIDFDVRFRHKEGRWLWLSWNATYARKTYYAAGRDITFLREARDKLLESEGRIRGILDSTVDAILTIDHRGIIQQANAATERLLGYDMAELVGRNVSMLMPSPHRERHDGYIAHYLRTHIAKVIGIGRETLARRKDGSIVPIDLAVSEVILSEGRRLFTGIIRDITERKTAQQRLEDVLAELKRSNEGLTTTLNQLQVGSMIIGPDGHIAFVSEKCGALDFWPEAETVLDERWDTALPLDAASRESFKAMMQADAATRTRLTLHLKDEAGEDRVVEAEIHDAVHDRETRLAFFYDVSELHDLRAQAAAASHGQMVGRSEAMRAVYDRILQVARGDWTVLIEGETGSGKELVARAIHAASPRKHGPFIAVNCAGLTDSLLESQLFGHRKGAFTGAVVDQKGLFEAAGGGTILLDEIGDVSLKMQTALLRVLQEHELIRIGDVHVRKVDVRVLAATNRDLVAEVAAGRFREDLFYRLRVARVTLPPLRERRDDISLLTQTFLAEQRMSSGKPTLDISSAAMDALRNHEWPGNVRELKGAIEFGVISAQSGRIELSDLPPEVRTGRERARPSAPPPSVLAVVEETPSPRSDVLPKDANPSAPENERDRILEALEWAEGNRARAARKLGMSRATFYRRLTALGIPVKTPGES